MTARAAELATAAGVSRWHVSLTHSELVAVAYVVVHLLPQLSRADRVLSDHGALLDAFEHAERSDGKVHLVGLVSNGRVHSDIEHLFALIDLAVGVATLAVERAHDVLRQLYRHGQRHVAANEDG